jgi:hypothetical protein
VLKKQETIWSNNYSLSKFISKLQFLVQNKVFVSNTESEISKKLWLQQKNILTVGRFFAKLAEISFFCYQAKKI